MSPARPVDAATLLVAREGQPDPQIYMVRRHPGNRFMANALVFPGGRFDEADAAPEMLACCEGLDADGAARHLGMEPREGTLALGLHVTAIRECFEESGLLFARRRGGAELSADELSQLRGELLSGAGLAGLCDRRGLRLLLGELHPLERWITPEIEPSRFDARFLLARAPAGQIASPDPRETTFGCWLSAEQTLAEDGAGRELLAPPTLTILERQRRCTTVNELLGRCPARMPVIRPRYLEGTMPPIILLPGDHRHRDPRSSSGPEHYVVLGPDGHWARVCSADEPLW